MTSTLRGKALAAKEARKNRIPYKEYAPLRQAYIVAVADESVILDLLTRLEAAEKDAARYRWLRDGPEEWDCFSTAWLGGLGIYGDGPVQMDMAIDKLIAIAALSAGGENK